MSLDGATLAAILLMAAITYGTRIAGLLFADRLALSGRAKAAFDAIPPAVLTAVIAPAALATGWRETLAAAVAALAAARHHRRRGRDGGGLAGARLNRAPSRPRPPLASLSTLC